MVRELAPHGVIPRGHPPHGWNELDELVPAMASDFSENTYAHPTCNAAAYPRAWGYIWSGTKQIQLRSLPGGLSRERGTIVLCSVTVRGAVRRRKPTKQGMRVHVVRYDL